jgi:hypothetical protein
MKHMTHKFDSKELSGRFGTNNKLMTNLQELATYDTAHYFYNQSEQPEFIPAEEPETFATLDASKSLGRAEAFNHANVDGFVAEYGIDKGNSLIQLCKHFKKDKVFGFDGFEGLPGGVWPGNTIHKGMFDYGGKTPFTVPSNGHVTVGWFNKTLPNFDYKKKVAKYLHIDCDVYSSTVDILTTLQGKIVPGTVITFDDYCNHTNWRQGEWKAWQEFVEKNKINYKYLYVAGMSVTLIVK